MLEGSGPLDADTLRLLPSAGHRDPLVASGAHVPFDTVVRHSFGRLLFKMSAISLGED